MLVDRREKTPYLFQGLRAGSKRAYRPLIVPWEWAHLETGDYSIRGYEDRVTIERKSLEDLYSTLSGHRKRFEREHERMREIEFKAVVIEASWEKILRQPPKKSGLKPASVFGTYASWRVKYGVPWEAMEDRRLAEKTVFRLLERWWNNGASEE